MNRATTYVLFATMCLVWGLTWIAIKTGVTAIPPLFFAGTRFIAAGTLLLLWLRFAAPREVAWRRVRRADWPAIGVASLLVIVGTYSLLFWGMKNVASGLAAVVNLSLMPVALFAIGLAYGEEQFSLRRSVAIAVGIIGLGVLFQPVDAARSSGVTWGMAAIIGGTVAYCWGSVLSRPLLRAYTPELVSGWTCLIGGIVLIVLSLLIEPIGLETLAAFTKPGVAASWLFLVLGGSLVAFTFYMRLVRDWGASRAGLYAFVSPIIAVVTGVVASGERLHAGELTGMAIMLAATAFALGGARQTAPARS